MKKHLKGWSKPMKEEKKSVDFSHTSWTESGFIKAKISKTLATVSQLKKELFFLLTLQKLTLEGSFVSIIMVFKSIFLRNMLKSL